MDKAIVGDCRVGYFRVGVYRPDYDRLVKALEGSGTISAEFTRRRLQLDSPPDSTTGWYSKSFEDFEIEGVLIQRSTSRASMVHGVYVRLDATLFTADVVKVGDEILDDYSNLYYEVKGVKALKVGNSFSHREADLTQLPLHELSWSPSAPDVEDTRYRTKVYWDTYLDDSNLQRYRWLVAYSRPNYPMIRVYLDKHMDIIFSIDPPDSEPLIDYNLSAFGYRERVTTHILTLDTELNHLAETELRRILRDYPTGSQRTLERRSTVEHNLGSATLYDTPVVMRYERDTT